MHAGLQLRYIIIGGTGGIAAEVELEVVVQHIGLRHVAINDELQVVADAVSGGVDAILVGELGDEVRCGVHIAAIDERRGVQIAIDAGTDAIVARRSTSAHDEMVVGAVGKLPMVVGNGMQVDQSGGILVVDVHRNGKRQLEAAIAHAVVSVVERLRAIAIGEGSLRSVFLSVIQLAGDRLLGIANGGSNNAVEVAGIGHMSHHAGNTAGLQLGHLHAIAIRRDAVDGVDNNRPCRNVQRQGRVAEQLILQHVHAGIKTLRDHFVLGQHLCLAKRNGFAIGADGEHMSHEGHIHHLVLRDKHRACRAIEGNGTAFVVQNGCLADGSRGAVVRHDVA